MKTSVTVISDTHGRHEELVLPPGDLLIHCGDMFDLAGSSGTIGQMDAWFGQQKFKKILCTGGNHDHQLQAALLHRPQPFANAHFLHDALVEFQGLRIYGAPWVPDLPTHAFYQSRRALAKHWSKIPASLDILVTHTPPKNILDLSSKGRSYGCEALARALARAAPRVHCFGHVHASAGSATLSGTLFVNAASSASRNGRLRPATIFVLEPPPRIRASQAGRTRFLGWF